MAVSANPDPAPSDPAPSVLSAIIGAATAVDGQPPFSDQSLVDLASGARELVRADLDGQLSGAALVSDGAESVEAELVVHPDARHQGLGAGLLSQVIERTTGDLLIWAHGDHPDARALAARHGFVAVRELLQLRAPVTAPPPADQRVTAFRPGVDDAAWLSLNARAFASHPEQGKLTQSDLDARKGSDWFTPEDFLLLRDADGGLVGFCWLKVEGGIGEFYAVGVDPDRQGEGLGRSLVNAGLRRLTESGIREASLYVDGDNLAAVGLYRSLGFGNHTVDIQYRLDRGRRPSA